MGTIGSLRKNVLYKIMISAAPSDGSLVSIMIVVENIINSRPLPYVPVDDEAGKAITPNHFLVDNSSGLKSISSW